jgi:hypothetical protein
VSIAPAASIGAAGPQGLRLRSRAADFSTFVRPAKWCLDVNRSRAARALRASRLRLSIGWFIGIILGNPMFAAMAVDVVRPFASPWSWRSGGLSRRPFCVLGSAMRQAISLPQLALPGRGQTKLSEGACDRTNGYRSQRETAFYALISPDR